MIWGYKCSMDGNKSIIYVYSDFGVNEDRFDKAILALKARKKFIDGGILPASMCDIKHLALML
jgi:hypothetical protein